MILLPLSAVSVEIDTNKVRKPSDLVFKQSGSKKALRIPRHILQAPFKIIEFVSRNTIYEAVQSSHLHEAFSLVGDVGPYWGFTPVVSYGNNAGFKYGAKFNSKEIFTEQTRLTMKSYYSTHDYQKYQLGYFFPHSSGDYDQLSIVSQYRKRPRENFYGLGASASKQSEVAFNYNYEEVLITAAWTYPLFRSASARLEASYLSVNIFDGEDPSVPGDLDTLQTRFNLADDEMSASRFWTVASEIAIDKRDHKGQPSRGGHYVAGLSYNRGMDRSSELEYLQWKVDLRQYLNIFKKRILAFRLYLESINLIGDSKAVPFYLLPSLGGKDDLRGFRSRRFADRNLALASVEYRYPVFGSVDAFLFVDGGRVFRSFDSDLSLSFWRNSIGGGFRVWGSGESVASALLAKSNEGYRFYLQVAEGF